MALTINQSASVLCPAQSPVIFTVAVPTPEFTASRFQYLAKLDYWEGSTTSVPANTSSIIITKFPNNSGVGIFDFSKILSSTLQDNLIEVTSSTIAYRATFNSQYYAGVNFITSSKVTSKVNVVYDGYAINPEVINANISTKGLYPFLTDGPLTQSVLITDKGTISVNGNNVYTYVGNNGSTGTIAVSSGTSTSNIIKQIPIGPAESNFPLNKTNLTSFTISSNSKTIKFDVATKCKYTPIRISFKNRFGQLDFFNFYKVSTKSFSTTQRTFQPNIGNWNNSTFSLNNYTNQTQRYVVDNEQMLIVNTDFVSEDYNEIFKQMLLSDEMYFYNNNDIIPISIATSNMSFKTGINDKLIQYQFEFNLGRNFKQIV